METKLLRAHLRNPQSRTAIISEFCKDKVVLDLGCVNHDVENVNSEGWLHKSIIDVASETLGVDYLVKEVEILRQRGFQVMWGDVNKPLKTDRQFDVIVVGHLIEHLSNFEGLMNNLNRLLLPGGVALICTPSPFFREQYFYSALKNDILVNPEHTCWIDPVTLDQLSRRFGFETSEVRWIKEKWYLSQTVFNGKGQSLDILAQHWTYHHPRTLLEKIASPGLAAIFRMLVQPDRRLRLQKRYGSDLERYLYMRFKGVFVDAWWWLRRSVIPTSDINRHEVFMSVLKRSGSSAQSELTK
jgi:SAM-dependent methyltransferase